MIRVHYTVPLEYSTAASQFVNNSWVWEIVEKAAELSDVTPHTILMGNHRRHYDLPLEMFAVPEDIFKWQLSAPANVLKYDTDSV